MEEERRPKPKDFFSESATLKDYSTEFKALSSAFDAMVAYPVLKGGSIAECRTKFEKQKGLRTFAQMLEEQYEGRSGFEEYKETIEKLNKLVKEINAEFAKFFEKENPTEADEDAFIAAISPLVKNSDDLITSALAEKNK